MSARPASVDPRSPRFGATITTVALVVVLLLGLTGAAVAATVLLALLCALFAWGAFAGIGRHPYGALFRRFVRPRLAPPAELEDARPPTFAQGIGFAVSLVGVAFGLLGLPVGLIVATAVALVAAFLNAAFDLCLGCRIYVLLVRLGITGRGATTA